jgi:hypothetical protein
MIEAMAFPPLFCHEYNAFLAAQRPAAQALGHFRVAVIILAGILKPHFNVFPRSLGQVA